MPEIKQSPSAAAAAEQGGSGSVEQRQSRLMKAGALQTAILTSANFSIIATDEEGIIQLFNVGTVIAPIIALRANAMPSDIKRGLEAGFHNYLTKPLKIAEFLHGLDAALAFARKSA
jgi:DNA-binding response OmpR family regulator